MQMMNKPSLVILQIQIVNRGKLHVAFLSCSYSTLQDTVFNLYSQSGIGKSCLVI